MYFYVNASIISNSKGRWMRFELRQGVFGKNVARQIVKDDSVKLIK